MPPPPRGVPRRRARSSCVCTHHGRGAAVAIVWDALRAPLQPILKRLAGPDGQPCRHAHACRHTPCLSLRHSGGLPHRLVPACMRNNKCCAVIAPALLKRPVSQRRTLLATRHAQAQLALRVRLPNSTRSPTLHPASYHSPAICGPPLSVCAITLSSRGWRCRTLYRCPCAQNPAWVGQPIF